MEREKSKHSSLITENQNQFRKLEAKDDQSYTWTQHFTV